MAEARFHRGNSAFVMLLAAASTFIALTIPALARSTMPAHDPWIALDDRYVKRLPAAIRREIERHRQACGPLAAVNQRFMRTVAGPGRNSEFVTLHFDEVRCADRSRICGPQGCLHEVFAASASGYRLVFSERVRDITMRIVDRALAIEATCDGAGSTRCPRLIRLSGHRIGH